MNALRTSILFLTLYLIFAREITVGQFFYELTPWARPEPAITA